LKVRIRESRGGESSLGGELRLAEIVGVGTFHACSAPGSAGNCFWVEVRVFCQYQWLVDFILRSKGPQLGFTTRSRHTWQIREFPFLHGDQLRKRRIAGEGGNKPSIPRSLGKHNKRSPSVPTRRKDSRNPHPISANFRLLSHGWCCAVPVFGLDKRAG